eukprot:3421117-Pleurochrysis_carterae.AAC.1
MAGRAMHEGQLSACEKHRHGATHTRTAPCPLVPPARPNDGGYSDLALLARRVLVAAEHAVHVDWVAARGALGRAAVEAGRLVGMQQQLVVGRVQQPHVGGLLRVREAAEDDV